MGEGEAAGGGAVAGEEAGEAAGHLEFVVREVVFVAFEVLKEIS